MPFALVAYGAGLAVGTWQQLSRCLLFPCLASTFASYAAASATAAVALAAAGDVRGAAAVGQGVARGAGCAWDYVRCWYAVEQCNGQLHCCYCCDFGAGPCDPAYKHTLTGDWAEAPCKLCLWGARPPPMMVMPGRPFASASGTRRRSVWDIFLPCP